MRIPIALVAIICIAIIVASSITIGLPIGTEFQINQYTTNNQLAPYVDSNSTGNYVVAWQSAGQDGSGYGIYSRRYDTSGPIESEVLVNTNTTGSQEQPCTAMNSSGAYVVVWQSPADYWDGIAWGSTGIYRQCFNSSGNPWLEGQIRVNSFTRWDQTEPAVAMASSFAHVVVWTDFNDASSTSISGQRFDQDGKPTGAQFTVNTYTADDQNAPNVAMADSGDFVVVWESLDQDGSVFGVFGQAYNSSGTKDGTEFRVNTYTSGSQMLPAIAMNSSGYYIVVWASYAQDGDMYGIYAKMYDNTNTEILSEFLVNNNTASDQFSPDVTMNEDGGFVVTWMSLNQDGSNYGIYAKQYDRYGQALGTEFLVNTYTSDEQRYPAISFIDADDYLIAWQSNGQDGSSHGVYGQLFNSIPIPEGDLLVMISVIALTCMIFFARESKKRSQ